MSKNNNAIRVPQWEAPAFELVVTQTEWDEILKAEGLGDPDKPWVNHVLIRETDGLKLPAKPVGEGGVFWRERIYINDARQERKKVQPDHFVCEACGKHFKARKGSKYCTYNCRLRIAMRRSRHVNANLPIHSEK